MSKQYTLSAEERKLLEHLDREQLQFFSKIKGDKDYELFRDAVNLLIDYEKNIFFSEDESQYTREVWQAKHAYARGKVASFVMLLHLLVGSVAELERRQGKKEK